MTLTPPSTSKTLHYCEDLLWSQLHKKNTNVHTIKHFRILWPPSGCVRIGTPPLVRTSATGNHVIEIQVAIIAQRSTTEWLHHSFMESCVIFCILPLPFMQLLFHQSIWSAPNSSARDTTKSQRRDFVLRFVTSCAHRSSTHASDLACKSVATCAGPSGLLNEYAIKEIHPFIWIW